MTNRRPVQLTTDKDTYWRWAAAFVVVVGCALRLFQLGTESLTNDELSSVLFSSNGPLDAVYWAIKDNGPPLYYMLQSLVLAVVPTNEVTMRLISALSGALSVWLIYLIGLRMYSRQVAVLAAGAFAISRVGISLGQDARAYSLVMLFVLCAMYTLLLLIERPSAGRYVAHGVALLLAAYTHLFGAIAGAGIVLGVLLRPKLAKKLGWPWLATLSVVGLLYLPYLVVLRRQAAMVAGIASGGWWQLAAPLSVSNDMTIGMAAHVPWEGKNSLLAVLFLGMAAFGAFGSQEMADEQGSEQGGELTATDRATILVSWLLMVYVGSLLVSKYVIPIFGVRTIIVATPALYLLAANGLGKVWRPAAIAFVVAGLFLSANTLGIYYTTPQKEPWRVVTQYLIAVKAQRDGIVASAPFVLKNVSEYAKMIGDENGIGGKRIGRLWDETRIDKAMSRAVAGKSSVYALLSHVRPVRGADTSIDAWFQRQVGWRLAESRQFGRIKVKHYVRRL